MARKARAWVLVLGGLGLWGGLLAGCTSTSPNVRPTPPLMQIWPNPALPTKAWISTPLLWLEVGTAPTYGQFMQYHIRLGMNHDEQGFMWPTLDSPQPPRLALYQGQQVTLKHDQPTDPTFLVIEFDEQNMFLHSTVISAPNNQYTPIATGVYRLSVRAQWAPEFYTTYFFNLEVKP